MTVTEDGPEESPTPAAPAASAFWCDWKEGGTCIEFAQTGDPTCPNTLKFLCPKHEAIARSRGETGKRRPDPPKYFGFHNPEVYQDPADRGPERQKRQLRNSPAPRKPPPAATSSSPSPSPIAACITPSVPPRPSTSSCGAGSTADAATSTPPPPSTTPTPRQEPASIAPSPASRGLMPTPPVNETEEADLKFEIPVPATSPVLQVTKPKRKGVSMAGHSRQPRAVESRKGDSSEWALDDGLTAAEIRTGVSVYRITKACDGEKEVPGWTFRWHGAPVAAAVKPSKKTPLRGFGKQPLGETLPPVAIEKAAAVPAVPCAATSLEQLDTELTAAAGGIAPRRPSDALRAAQAEQSPLITVADMIAQISGNGLRLGRVSFLSIDSIEVGNL